MALLLAPVLFIAVIIYVAYPLLSESSPVESEKTQDDIFTRLLEEKDEVINSLKDIDMDYRMGKLSLQDYNKLRNDFELRAADVFRRLEEAETASDENR
jgi:hypothetical protein